MSDISKKSIDVKKKVELKKASDSIFKAVPESAQKFPDIMDLESDESEGESIHSESRSEDEDDKAGFVLLDKAFITEILHAWCDKNAGAILTSTITVNNKPVKNNFLYQHPEGIVPKKRKVGGAFADQHHEPDLKNGLLTRKNL